MKTLKFLIYGAFIIASHAHIHADVTTGREVAVTQPEDASSGSVSFIMTGAPTRDPLIEAISKGDLASFTNLLAQSNINVDVKDNIGTALSQALMFPYFIRDKNSPEYKKALATSHDMADALLKKGAKPTQYDPNNAAKFGMLDILKKIQERVKKINWGDVIMEAFGPQLTSELFDYLVDKVKAQKRKLTYKQGTWSILGKSIDAYNKGEVSIEYVDKLLQKGAPVDSDVMNLVNQGSHVQQEAVKALFAKYVQSKAIEPEKSNAD